LIDLVGKKITGAFVIHSFSTREAGIIVENDTYVYAKVTKRLPEAVQSVFVAEKHLSPTYIFDDKGFVGDTIEYILSWGSLGQIGTDKHRIKFTSNYHYDQRGITSYDVYSLDGENKLIDVNSLPLINVEQLEVGSFYYVKGTKSPTYLLGEAKISALQGRLMIRGGAATFWTEIRGPVRPKPIRRK
jgi:hypothetical protein